MPLLNYRTKIWTKLLQTKIKSQMDRKKTKGIANADKKNLSGQFYVRTNFFCPDNFFDRTIFLSGQFFCSDNFFVWTFFCPDKRAFTTK